MADRTRPPGWPEDPYIVADVPGVQWFEIGDGEFLYPIEWGDHPVIGDDPCDALPHVDRWELVRRVRLERARKALNSTVAPERVACHG